MTKTCEIEGCDNPSIAFGACQKHYMRLRRHGTTELPPKDNRSRFFRHVIKRQDGCWIWTGAPARDGHGQFSVFTDGKERNWRAHRLSWTWANGDIPKGMWVYARCGNKQCVNPDHLYLGKRLDTVNPAAKLKPHDVKRVRAMWATNRYTQKELANAFDVSRQTISGIVNRQTWKHVI